MAANVIHGIECDFLRGRPIAGNKERVEEWSTAGVDGYGAQLLGLGDTSFTLTVVKYGEPAAVETWLTALEGTQGDVGTIIDAWETTHQNCLVTRVHGLKKTAEVGNGGCRGELQVEGVKLPPTP